MRFAIILSLLLSFVAGCTQTSGEGDITGRVTWNGEGVALAWVEVYTKPEQDRTTPPVAETASGEDGGFTLTVPTGRYWVWAKATVEEGGRERRLVGQAVPNPVEPGPGRDGAVVIALADPSGFSTSAGPRGAGVEGTVSFPPGMNPKARAIVYVYRGEIEKPTGPGFVAVTEPDEVGKFKVNLEPGLYTIAARLRKSGRDYGPPEADDLVAVARARVEGENYRSLGTMRLAGMEQGEWSVFTAKLGDSDTVIAGKIVNGDSSPARGIRVLAFTDSRMAGKPTAISPATREDGVFSLNLPEGGVYFIGARSRIGGPASPGEKIGTHRGPDGGGLDVKKGSTTGGIEIKVEEIW